MSRKLQADDVSPGDHITLILDNEHIRGEILEVVRSQSHSIVSALHVDANDETFKLQLYKTSEPGTAAVTRFGTNNRRKQTDTIAEFDIGP